jgi:hypothetical protein
MKGVTSMATANDAVFGRTLTSAVAWAVRSGPHAVIAGGVLAAAVVAAVLFGRVARRRLAAVKARRAAAAEAAVRGENADEGLDPFTVYVTLMATFLSVNGMWHVFTEVMHLPWVVRLVASTVLESSGFAFMRAARRDIHAKRPATRHVAIVWAIAVLAGGLSAGASHSVLEGVIRVVLPLLAVQLCHSWMLPVPTRVTLTQHEMGKRAWRYVRAHRRLERADSRIGQWFARKLLNLESDRLTKRSLMTGDSSSVLSAAERIATGEALAGLGVTDPRTHAGPGGLADPQSGSATDPDPETNGPTDPAHSDPHPGGPTDPRTRHTDPLDGLALDAEAGALVEQALPVALSAGGGRLAGAVNVPAQREAWPLPQQNGAAGLAGADPRTRSHAGPGALADPQSGSATDPDPETNGPTDPAHSDPHPGGPTDPRTRHTDPRTRTHALAATGGRGPAVHGLADPRAEDGAEHADPRWSDETARIAREIVAQWRRDGVKITSRAFYPELRARRGSVSNAHKSALYAYAIAPDLPDSEDEYGEPIEDAVPVGAASS